MSPLRFTRSLILSSSTMLELHLSAWSCGESIQPCVDYLSKWPQQRERGEAGVNLCPQESTPGWGRLTAKQKPSLTHAHLLALEQKRLRTQGARAGVWAADAPYCPDNRRRSRNETQTISTPNQTISIWNIHIFNVGAPKMFAGRFKPCQELYKQVCLPQSHSVEELSTRNKTSSFNGRNGRNRRVLHLYGTGIATE